MAYNGLGMNVGVCRISLRIPESHGLKDKRSVARSLVERVRNRFNISIAEIEDHDKWQVLTLGLSCVSNQGRHVNEVLSTVLDYIDSIRGDAELLDYQIEIINAF